MREHGSLSEEPSLDVPYLIFSEYIDIGQRSNSKKVVIMFTDEEAQHYLGTTHDRLCREITSSNNELFVVTELIHYSTFDCNIPNLTLLPLTPSPEDMVEHLGNIVDIVCTPIEE
jgi:hypothetical protein